MSRGYRWAFFLAVLFACIALSGCKSGGTTGLAVATTSLPNAVIGTPYAATLTATGGTPGYTWSQISGGAMPAGTSTTPYSNAGYTIEAASGRVSITGLTAAPPIVYLAATGATDDEIAGFLVGSDTQASSGVVVTQSVNTPAYLLSSISGNYAASIQEDGDGRNGSALGIFSFAHLLTDTR